jgi:hypothetical protein
VPVTVPVAMAVVMPSVPMLVPVAVIVPSSPSPSQASESPERGSKATEEPSSCTSSLRTSPSSGHLTHLGPHRAPLCGIARDTGLEGHESLQVAVTHGEEELEPRHGVWTHAVERLEDGTRGELIEEVLSLRG